MTEHPNDPERLVTGEDELAGELRALLRAEAGVPSAAALSRIAAGVARGTGIPLAGGPATGAITASKLGAAVGLALLAAGGLWYVRGRAPELEPPTRAVAAADHGANGFTQAPPMPAPTPVPASALQSEVSRSAAPDARPAPRRPGVRGPAHRAPDRAPAAASAPPDPQAELSLLERAQRALHVDPRRALRLAKAHGRRYAHGQFAPEREMIAIEALLALEQAPAARRRAVQFRKDFPHSPHLPRLGELLGGAGPVGHR